MSQEMQENRISTPIEGTRKFIEDIGYQHAPVVRLANQPFELPEEHVLNLLDSPENVEDLRWSTTQFIGQYIDNIMTLNQSLEGRLTNIVVPPVPTEILMQKGILANRQEKQERVRQLQVARYLRQGRPTENKLGIFLIDDDKRAFDLKFPGHNPTYELFEFYTSHMPESTQEVMIETDIVKHFIIGRRDDFWNLIFLDKHRLHHYHAKLPQKKSMSFSSETVGETIIKTTNEPSPENWIRGNFSDNRLTDILKAYENLELQPPTDTDLVALYLLLTEGARVSEEYWQSSDWPRSKLD